MISFDNINKPDWKCRFLRWFFWNTVVYKYGIPVHNHIYYHRFYVLHSGRIPKGEPAVVICNHQNGTFDALGILYALRKDGRHPFFSARADVFKKEFVAKILLLLRIMPAFRVKDVGKENLGGNYEVFDKSAEILAEDNGLICIFPEAEDEYFHHLRTFKKGFARIAFAAAKKTNFEKAIYILPVSNHYSNFFGMRNNLIISFGEPFTFEDLYDIYKQHPQRALKMLAERSREKVSAIMLDIKDINLYEEYDMIRRAYSKDYVKKQGLSTAYFPNVFEADKKIVATLDQFRKDCNEKFNALMAQAKEYNSMLHKLRLHDLFFEQKLGSVPLLLRCLAAILLVPFVVYGFIMNFIPYHSCTPVLKQIKSEISHASFHFFWGALLSFPLWYLILFTLFWSLTGIWWAALLYLVSLPVSLVVYVHSKIFIKKQYNYLRCFCFRCRGNPFYLRAIELRKEIMGTVEKLMILQDSATKTA